MQSGLEARLGVVVELDLDVDLDADETSEGGKV